MIDVSVIIVNYNVRYFIEQCLSSVLKSKSGLNVEIIVVDNNSVDNSVNAIKAKFPQVKLIANKVNVGFAKANNQAIKIAKGKYFLLLNPDTLVEEDTLKKSFDFMENDDKVGALGVKLIDGEGKFLPESKRSLPTLLSSLYRFSGLSKVFPKSKIFNKYNLGFLEENETNEVDVLCGAFMFIRADILPEVGYLDEDFFMYGEDIDYSYRIQKAGYKIIYFPKTTIIHFKGESTKKSSLKYHNIFYKAMAIFAKKHYGGKAFNPLLWLINIAVIVLAVTNYLKEVIKNYFLPIIDVILFYVILNIVQNFWANYHFKDPEYYDVSKTSWIFLLFAIIWVIGIKLSGGYQKSHFVNSLKGLGIGTIIILVIYSLLPENFRFSRAIVLISSVANFIFLILFRLIANIIFPKLFQHGNNKKTVIVGSKEEVDRVKRIMNINGIEYNYVGALIPENLEDNDFKNDFLGKISNLEEIIKTMNINEVIFCLKNIEMSDVVDRMGKIGNKVKVKIVPDEAHSIVGSSGRNSRGEFYNMDMSFKLGKRNVRFFKYILDFLFAIFLLFLYPIIRLLNPNFKFQNVLQVLLGKKTWVSYIQNDGNIHQLPKIKEGVYTPIFLNKGEAISTLNTHNINIIYAKNYNVWLDIEYLFKHIFDTKGKKNSVV